MFVTVYVSKFYFHELKTSRAFHTLEMHSMCGMLARILATTRVYEVVGLLVTPWAGESVQVVPYVARFA